MKRFKILFVMLALLTGYGTVQAQLNRRIGNAVERAAERAVTRQAERRTENAVNEAIDRAMDGSNESQRNSNSNSNRNTQPATGAPANTGNANNAPAEAAATTPAPAPAATTQEGAAKAAEMVYAKSDFVSGDVIFFDDDLANEKMGEFPSQWDLEIGNAEIAMINGEKCISLIGHTIIIPLMENSTNYLPDEFTIEYDVYWDVSTGEKGACEIRLNDGSKIDIGRINSLKGKSSLTTAGREGGYYTSHKPMDQFINGSSFIGRQYFNMRDDGNMIFRAIWFRPDGNSGTQEEDITLNPNEWQHVSISFNKRALKYYINGVRVLNIPNMKQPANFWLWAEDGNAYVKNLRIAKGAVPLYDRMMNDGKFITYGITFDVGKSTVKPESMGEINRIVMLMTENTDLKFSVEGHTDNTGNAASNQTLSEARSQAVVDKLVENGIARDRLTAAGKGQNAPLADNSTDEGRAKNRRVEFVKM